MYKTDFEAGVGIMLHVIKSQDLCTTTYLLLVVPESTI